MSRATVLAAGLAAAGRAAGEPLSPLPDRPGATALVAVGERTVAYVAWDEATRARLVHEQAALGLLAGRAVPVPRPVAVDEDAGWLLVERAAEHRAAGPAYVEAAVQAAAAIAAVPLPALAEPPLRAAGRGGSGARRAPRRGLALRTLRSLLGPVPVRAFLRHRAAAARLPRTTTAHGDFHPGNVLWDAHARRVTVIDLELLAPAPVGLDLCQLWCGLEEAADRDLVLAALRALPGAQPDVLLPWIAVRSLADVTAALPGRARERDLVDLAVDTWRHACALTARGAS